MSAAWVAPSGTLSGPSRLVCRISGPVAARRSPGSIAGVGRAAGAGRGLGPGDGSIGTAGSVPAKAAPPWLVGSSAGESLIVEVPKIAIIHFQSFQVSVRDLVHENVS
jgi:hypothetical protein